MFPNDPCFLGYEIYCITMLHILERCLWWWICVPALGAKIIFCGETRDGSSSASHCDITCSKQMGNPYRSVSLYVGDVKICSVRRAKQGCVCFMHQDRVQHALLLSLVLLIGKVQSRETKAHFLFTLSLIWH